MSRSFAKKISSSSTAATQSIARSSQTPGTSVVDSVVSFQQSPQMTRYTRCALGFEDHYN